MIEQGRELKFDNVLSLRKKMLQNDLNTEMNKIGELLLEAGLKRNGPVITATSGVEKNNDGQVCIDIEILTPLDKEAGGGFLEGAVSVLIGVGAAATTVAVAAACPPVLVGAAVLVLFSAATARVGFGVVDMLEMTISSFRTGSRPNLLVWP